MNVQPLLPARPVSSRLRPSSGLRLSIPSFLLVWLSLALALSAQVPATIRKGHHYVLSGLSPITNDPLTGIGTTTGTGASDAPIASPWFFTAAVDSSATGPESFTAPGAAPAAFTNGLSVAYPSQAALDAAYPNGNYALQFNGASHQLSLTGDAYPNAPLPVITTLLAGLTHGDPPMFANSILVLDPTALNTISTSFTTNYAPGHAYIDIRLIDSAGVTHDINTGTNFSTSQLTLNLPANSVAPGPGMLVLILYNFGSIDQSSTPGFYIGPTYLSQTQVQVQMANTPLTIVTQPQSQTTTVGGTVSFTVATAGAIAINYQWLLDGQPVGRNGATLTLTNVQASAAGTYTVRVLSAGNTTVTSDPVTLTVNPTPGGGGSPGGGSGGTPTPSAPQFTPAASSQMTAPGSTVVFSQTVQSSIPVTYQWFFNGTAIPNATHPELVIFSPTVEDIGSYTCTATNATGSTTSPVATLGFFNGTARPARLINLSVLGTLAPDGLLTVGYTTGGAGTSGAPQVLIRAIGPALGAFGVTGVLPDPRLSVLSGQTVVASNDNWGGDAAVASAIAATGAFPLTDPQSADAALVAALPNPPYTVQISGKPGASGQVLAEVYDTTPANVSTPPGKTVIPTQRLTNLSVLTSLPAGGLLTAGFVLDNTRTVLIRGIGPGLSAFGVTGAIPDMHLALIGTISGKSQTLQTNNAWNGDPQLVTAAARVGAFALPDPTSKDGVIIISLPPGSYTAQASSLSGKAGSALVEVYEVP